MARRTKTNAEQGQRGILGDEAAAQLTTEVADLRDLVNTLSERVHAQFTTISAHSEIAREHTEMVRNEARAEMERSRDMLIGLCEQTRREVGAAPALHVPGAAGGVSQTLVNERLTEIERCVANLTSVVERCFDRQRELADTMTALLDTVIAERRGEPVAGLSLA